MTDDVCRTGAPGLTVDVEGDDVDINRDWVRDDDVDPDTGCCRGLFFTVDSEGFVALSCSGLL